MQARGARKIRSDVIPVAVRTIAKRKVIGGYISPARGNLESNEECTFGGAYASSWSLLSRFALCSRTRHATRRDM